MRILAAKGRKKMDKTLYIIIVNPTDSFSTPDPVPLFVENNDNVTGTLAKVALAYADDNGLDPGDFTWASAFNDIPADFWKAHGVKLVGQDEAFAADGWDFYHVYEADRLDDYV